jgi:hypothetical protein
VFNYAVPETVAKPSELDEGVSPVSIIGVFDATFTGIMGWSPLLGAFKEVQSMHGSVQSPPDLR